MSLEVEMEGVPLLMTVLGRMDRGGAGTGGNDDDAELTVVAAAPVCSSTPSARLLLVVSALLLIVVSDAKNVGCDARKGGTDGNDARSV